MNKETIFIYSIARNRDQSVSRFYGQVKEIVQMHPEYNFLLCIYENDSTDNTKRVIQSLDWSFVEHEIIMEDIGTQYFGSIADENRVRNLADARNKALEAKDFLDRSDYVLMLEFDMGFTQESINRLFKFKDQHKELDVVSARSIERTSPNKNRLYDTWGTRRNSTEVFGNLFDDWKRHDYQKYYATSNGLCMYRSQPLKDGIRYGYINKSLKSFDCEMVVICDELQRAGYNNIYILYPAVALHMGA